VKSASSASDPRYAALAQAESTDEPVTIDSLTTADSTTQALPDGTLATTTTLEPTRMQDASGDWETIDPTLVQNADGTISTTATPNGLTLSGGGTGPAITATDQSGHSLSLSLPVSLPAPTLSGPSASYQNVYPGVNLTVTAAPTGGFSEVFTVTDPAAQAQADSLKFTTELNGLTMSQASDDSLTVTDSTTGQTVMNAPPAIMWDSATTGTPASGVSDEFEDATNADSSTAGPGLGAHTGALPVSAVSNTLTLSASPSSLDTISPVYPVYDDPSWTEPYQSGGTEAYDEFEEGGDCNYNNFDNVSQPGVGTVSTNTECPGPYESYFQIDTSNVLDPSYDIQSATLKISEEYSSQNDCNEGSSTISIYTTGQITNAVESNYWTSKPAHGEFIDSETLKSVGNGDGTMCSGGVPGNFNVLNGIQQARANNWPNWTFAMADTGPNDGDNSLERFNNNPSIYTVYDIAPNQPDNLTTWPTFVTGISSTGKLATTNCPSSSDPGYLGIGNIGGRDIAVLSARLTTRVAAAQMYGAFTLDDMTTGSSSTYDSAGKVASGADVSVQTGSMTNGDEYNWSVVADDTVESSVKSPTCFFKADVTPPSNPSVTASTWNTLSSGTPTTVYAGTPGSFSVTATDKISGIAGFYYSIDDYPVPSSGGTFKVGTSATLNYTPLAWGAHTLYVQSLDNAGNVSAVTSYTVYVPWSPASDGVTGAISGGPVPDLTTTPTTGTQAGDLVMVPGESTTLPGSPTTDVVPEVISNPSNSPDGTSPWSDYQVTHDGSYTNHPGFDDLWAFDISNNNLYLYLNNSKGTPYETTANVNDIDKPSIDSDAKNNAFYIAQGDKNACVTTKAGSCTNYDDASWPAGTQILAPGDLYAGDPNTVATTGAVDNNAPGLLTVENGSLWYYQGQEGAHYLNIAEQLGTSGWDGTTLIGTDTTGSGSTTKTYLWARINSNGQIMQYPITFDTVGNLVSLGTPTGGSGTQLTFPDAANHIQATTNTLSTAAYPQLYAWDMHGTTDSDLIATTPSGTIIDWPGTTPTTTSTGTSIAQFTTPESLAAATATSTVSLPSVGTDYPSGTTWDNGASTLDFNQGQLTVSLDATKQVVTQYGTPNAGSYLTLQNDGNLAIYSSGGSALWALNQGGLNVPYASGDALTLTGSTLTLKSSSGSTLWTAETSVPISQGTTGETAFTASNGDLAITIGAGSIYTQDPIATGTSPSIADLGGNNYEAAFQATNGDLETYSNTAGVADTGYAMKPGTSPSIAAYSGGGWVIAFQGFDGSMQIDTSAGKHIDPLQGMDAGSSPSVAATPGGGYEVAYQINTNDLHTDAFSSLTDTTGTINDPSLGMASGTNPAVAALTTGGYEIAFQANTGSLWLNGPGSGGGNESLGMASGTSPSITALPGGEWQTAFEDNTNVLWTHGNIPGTTSTGITMATGTNPAITGLGGEDFALAWQSTSHTLTTMVYGGSSTNTGRAMTAGTNPSLAP
jgi:hypothetical protein